MSFVFGFFQILGGFSVGSRSGSDIPRGTVIASETVSLHRPVAPIVSLEDSRESVHRLLDAIDPGVVPHMSDPEEIIF